MRKTIVSDTSCLILLEKVGALDLLHKVFGEILEAKLSGNITSLKPLLAKIKQTDFHFSKELEKKF